MAKKEVEKVIEVIDVEKCLALEKEIIELKQKKERFDVVKFLKGLFFNKYFIAWFAWFYLVLLFIGVVGRIVPAAQTADIIRLVLTYFAGVTAIWMVVEALKKFIGKGELKVGANFGATFAKTANTTANVADIIKASK